MAGFGSPASPTEQRARSNDRRRFALLAVLSVVLACCAPSLMALETDQFYAWTRQIADSTAVINARMNLEIARALADVTASDRGPVSCEVIARAVRDRLEMEIFQPIELWVLQSPLVDRVPAMGEEVRHYFDTGIYRRHGPLDVGMWIPPSPTLEVGGVRFGSDKLAHFVSSGWKYRNAYLRRRARGMSHGEAERAAIHWGILEEKSINGMLSTGIFARADLEANYQGMRFYLELCDGPDPILAVRDGEWQLRREFDIAAHVTPEWDESYNASIYGRRRWHRVRPEMLRSCPLLSDPRVRERRERYRARDGMTATEEVLEEHVHAGELADPAPYSIEVVCAEAPSLRRAAPAPPPVPGIPPMPDHPVGNLSGETDGDPVRERIIALERDREVRAFPVWGVHVSHLRGVSGSLGVLRADVPRTHDCRDLCDLRGVLVQAFVGDTGGQASVGYVRAVADGGDGGRMLSNVYLAFGGRVGVLRTWGDSPLSPRRQTLVGVEGLFTVTRVNFTAGAFVPVGGDGDRWAFAASLGFGF